MKIELAKKIKEIIEAAHANAEVHADEIRSVVEPFKNPAVMNRYTPEGLKETVHDGMREVIDAWNKLDVVYNQKLKAIIADAKDLLIPMVVTPFEKPMDYAASVNNALQFLQLEGTDLTDESAFDILKNFASDYDQMKLFKKVVGKYVYLEDAIGATNFPKTFGRFNNVESLLNIFGEIEATANMLFIHNKRDGGEMVILGDNRFSIPESCYEEINDESEIIDLAVLIDNIAASMIGSPIE